MPLIKSYKNWNQNSEEPIVEDDTCVSTLDDSDDEGEDLMESDEEEESESETEEDRSFIDDEALEDQGASFYRGVRSWTWREGRERVFGY